MGVKPSSYPHQVLDALLSDPLIQLVMRADRVDPAQLIALCQKLRSGPAPEANTVDPLESTMAIHPQEARRYRSGVGIMLLNDRSEVFVGQRLRNPRGAWQMPQGGIDPGEDPLAAAFRELREETGTDNVAVLAESPGWLRYDLPPELIGKAWDGRWLGQRQKWFAMRFLGYDAEINIATEHAEFADWCWVPPAEVPELIVSFKRQVYLSVLQQFRDLHTAEATSVNRR